MLIENIMFLRERFPAIRNYFLQNSNEVNTERITALNAKTGVKTFHYESEKNKFMVHSMYDPVREAERIIAKHSEKIKEDTHVFFYGIGIGHHILKFQQLFPDNSYSIYEPVPEIFLAMTKHVSLDSLITKKTRNLYIDNHDQENVGYLEEFKMNNKNIHIIVLPSYENIIKDKLDHFNRKVKDVVQSRRTNLGTNANFQKLWVMNSLLNFKEVLNTPNLLRDVDGKQFAGKPAIIVSAGPSLAEDMEYLRYIKENSLAYLIAVGSAINSLIEYDVLPDAVATYDPGLKNHLVFKKMIEKKIDSIPMLFGSSVGYETLKKFNGPKVHFITSQDKTSNYFLDEQLDMNQDIIIDSPSIAVMTFQVLNKLGASHIIFAGQNLGYLYDRRYSEGIDYDFIQSEVSTQEMEKAVTTKDVYGNEIKTNLGFNNMRVGIESYAKLYEGYYINTTKGGALIEGVPFQPIEEVIEKHLIQPIEKTVWWDASNSYEQGKFDLQKDQLKQSINDFHEIMSQFEIVIKSMANKVKLRDKLSIENDFVQFDKLNAKLNRNVYYKNFLSLYVRVHVEYMTNELKLAIKEKDRLVRGDKIVRLFSNFIIQCLQGNKELEQLVHSSLGDMFVATHKEM
ncbi:motility associated factor glycosyltransferase family protein [Oceanobacillus picturae]|uniref:motility associated factor glycosyltransferase family protein n=1 Tax=Oceanobacillus picturae TaxID=171693 RepID=UPI00362EA1BE